jgi:hypothetical protein
MISNTAPVTSGIPAQTSLLGIVSSPDSTSSFADQLASAVNQVGSIPPPGGGIPTNIGEVQRQNSDTPAASPANAPGASPVQYSFFQYLMDTPSAGAISSSPIATASPAAAAANKAQPASTFSEGIQQSGAPHFNGADPGWLSPPYYTPPAPVFVSWENPPGVINRTTTPESDLQMLAAQFINDPLQFGWGGVPATTPQEFVDNIVSYAQSRAAMYPKTCPEGYDPVAMGTKYANLVLDSIKKIQYDTVGASQYASVYDAWVAGVNTWPGASGATSVS